MCPIFVSLIIAPLSHGEPASVRTLHYSCCAEMPWKGHCALLSLKKHARRCLCICGRSVSKHRWEETIKMPWCTGHFLCSRNFACIVMGYFLVHHSFLISHSVVLTVCTPEGPVAGMQLQGCDRGVNYFKDCVSGCWVLWFQKHFKHLYEWLYKKWGKTKPLDIVGSNEHIFLAPDDRLVWALL
jgi:hypothetical protein